MSSQGARREQVSANKKSCYRQQEGVGKRDPEASDGFTPGLIDKSCDNGVKLLERGGARRLGLVQV